MIKNEDEEVYFLALKVIPEFREEEEPFYS